MNRAEQQGNSVEALKMFNNAIVTSRIYPPEAPQVTQGLERGYGGIKNFLRDHGPLCFGLSADAPQINGQNLPEEVIAAFPNLVVYRQLRQLGLPRLVLVPEMDRFAFSQLVAVFNTPVDKIKREGGGLEYTTSLGLAGFFPSDEAYFQEDAVRIGRRSAEGGKAKVLKVRQELIACLLGKDPRALVAEELAAGMAAAESAVEILAAGVGQILLAISRRKAVVADPAFPALLHRADQLLSPETRPLVVVGLAKLLSESLKDSALCVLLAQEYPSGLGGELYQAIAAALSPAKMAGVVAIYRQQLAKTGQVDESQPSTDLLGSTFLKLLNTEKGKHFLSSEKAKTIINLGEKERRNRRLEAGLQSLLQGKQAPLRSEEMLRALPEITAQLGKAGRTEDIDSLLARLAAALRSGEMLPSGALLSALVGIAELLVGAAGQSRLDQLLTMLQGAVLRSEEASEGVEKALVFLHRMMQQSWENAQEKRGDEILLFFHRLRSGHIVRPAAVKSLVGKVQDRDIQRALLPKLLARCLARPEERTLRHRLVLLGPVAIRFLIDSLINAEKADDRLLLIDMLTSQADALPRIVHERLPEHMPWYGKRNLIKLLGESGGEEDAEKVLPFLRFDDLRVQREALLCIYRIGGQERRRLLLEGLDLGSEPTRIQIIGALAAFCDPEVVGRLSQMLGEHENFSAANRQEMLLQLLDTLGRCPSTASAKGVQVFLQSRGQRMARKISDQVWSAAEKALEHIDKSLQESRKKHVQASQLRKSALKQAAKISRAKVDQRVVTGLPQEHAIRALLSQGDTAAAGEQILDLLERSARARNFPQAEKLREWLIDIDSTALKKIISAGEIIEREKAGSVERSHMEVWHELYDRLSSEEFSGFYQRLRHRKYRDGETVISQGTMQSSLFLINSGRVRVYAGGQGGEILFKTMGSGEIFGASSFFEASVWTISVAAVGDTDISSLSRDRFLELLEDYPAVEEKLADFCQRFQKIEEFVEVTGKDRRSEVRHSISARVEASLIDSRGQSAGVSAMIDLVDISLGGLACQVEITDLENARVLLGRKARVTLPGSERPGKAAMVDGDIIVVRGGEKGLYTIHCRFDTALEEGQLQRILLSARREPPGQ
jgi:CRP-like cAMP-binding protein